MKTDPTENRWDRKTGYMCRTCAFCVPNNEELGRCRRHAPTMQGYPVIYLDTDFCGDHKVASNPLKDAYIARQQKEAEAAGVNLSDPFDDRCLKKAVIGDENDPDYSKSCTGVIPDQMLTRKIRDEIVQGCLSKKFTVNELFNEVYSELGFQV